MSQRYYSLLVIKGAAADLKELAKFLKQFFKDDGWGDAEIIGKDDGEIIIEFVNAHADIPENCRRLSFRFSNVWFNFEYNNGDYSGGFIEVHNGVTRDLEKFSWKCGDCESFTESEPKNFYCDECGDYICPDCSAGASDDHDDH